MRVSASLGLVVLLASLTGCEQRNFDRCVTDNPDFQCETGKFCKPIDGDPNNLGMCVATECTVGAAVNGCSLAAPVCSAGRCKPCLSNDDCKANTPSRPFCQTKDGNLKGQCVECLAPTDCAVGTAKPACDQSDGLCKPCTRHDQCSTQVCVKDETLNVSSVPAAMRLKTGDCVGTDRILLVDVNCTSCGNLQTQINAASIDKPYILVKTYDEKSPISVLPKVGLPELHIVTSTADSSPALLKQAPPATMHYQNMTTPLLTVHGGASLTLEGMLIYNSSTGILCDSDNGAGTVPTGLTVRRSIIGLTDQAIRTKPKCQLTLDQTYIGTGPASFGSFTGGNFMALNLDATSFDITNSVFNHNFGMLPAALFGGIMWNNSTSTQGITGRIVNSTFYRHEPNGGPTVPLAIQCMGTAPILTIFNTLFVNPSTFAIAGRTYVSSSCRTPSTFDYIATDEALPVTPGGSKIIAASESALTAPLSGDLSLASTAQGIATGGAKTYNGISSPAVDVRGTARGATTVAIGAFEVGP